MEQKQSNFLNMTAGVIAGLRKEESVWAGEPEIAALYNDIDKDYKLVIAKIDQFSGIEKTGSTTAKNNVLDIMCSKTYRLCRKMSGYAKTRNDATLLAKVDLSMSAISRGSELVVISRCASLANLAEERLEDLKAVKVTQDEINAIRQLFDEHSFHIDNRSTKTTDKSETGKEIDTIILSIRKKLDSLDDMIEGLLEDESFIARYNASRQIIDYGKGKTLKNKSKDKDDNPTK